MRRWPSVLWLHALMTSAAATKSSQPFAAVQLSSILYGPFQSQQPFCQAQQFCTQTCNSIHEYQMG